MKNKLRFVGAACMAGCVLTLASCAFRTPAAAPPTQELLRVVANYPEEYAVLVDTGKTNRYQVPHDGGVKFGIPPYRLPCGVYLFDVLKVGGYGDPLKSWNIAITRKGKTVRRLSLRGMRELATD